MYCPQGQYCACSGRSVNVWRDYEIILLTYLILITRQSSGWNDWVIFLDLVERDFRLESLDPMHVGHRPSCSLSSVEPLLVEEGWGRSEKMKDKWTDYFLISWLKYFHTWYTGERHQWPLQGCCKLEGLGAKAVSLRTSDHLWRLRSFRWAGWFRQSLWS